MQEPRSVVLGIESKWKGIGENRKYTRIEEKMVYIPVLETLQTLLEDETIMSEVLCTSIIIRESVDSLCRDGTDTPIVCVH